MNFVDMQKDEQEKTQRGNNKGGLRREEDQNVEKNDAMLIEEMTSQGLSNFNPDLFFQNLTSQYKNAEQIYGKKLISLATGMDSEYVKRNIRIPEFAEMLKKKLRDKEKHLEREGLIEDSEFTKSFYDTAAKIMLSEEYERFYHISFNDSRGRSISPIGTREDEKPYAGERYRDISIKKSMRRSIRRKHASIAKDDLVAFIRESQPKNEIILAVDFSGSMKGEKISRARRAFASLLVRSMQLGDNVGLVTFNTRNIRSFSAGSPIPKMMEAMIKEAPYGKTSLSKAISASLPLFTSSDSRKHIMLITDAMPTEGKDPQKDTVIAASSASQNRVSISIVAIKAEDEAKKFAKKITEITNGRYYDAKEDNIGRIVIADYESYAWK